MKLLVQVTVNAPLDKVWGAYTNPDHIVHWNFASDDWYCPHSEVDLRVGGSFSSRMEAKDGSMGFDFAGVYTEIEPMKHLQYQFGDRFADVGFHEASGGVKVVVTFDPETENPLELQENGWQAILNNFAKHVLSS